MNIKVFLTVLNTYGYIRLVKILQILRYIYRSRHLSDEIKRCENDLWYGKEINFFSTKFILRMHTYTLWPSFYSA